MSIAPNDASPYERYDGEPGATFRPAPRQFRFGSYSRSEFAEQGLAFPRHADQWGPYPGDGVGNALSLYDKAASTAHPSRAGPAGQHCGVA